MVRHLSVLLLAVGVSSGAGLVMSVGLAGAQPPTSQPPTTQPPTTQPQEPPPVDDTQLLQNSIFGPSRSREADPLASAAAPAGWYLLPSASFSEVFDDNIFGATEGRQADAITRLTPTLGFGYRSAPLTFIGSVSVDAELFAVHFDQSGVNRKQVRFDLEARPSQVMTLRLRGLFDDTQTPSDLNTDLGLELGRTEARQGVVTAEASYRFGRRLTAEAAYTFTTSTADDISNTLHEGRLSLAAQLTPLDSGRVIYHIRRGDSDGLAVASDSVTFGWYRRLTEKTSFGVAAGPRFSDGDVQLEASASLVHRLSNGSVSFGFERTDTTIVGQRGLSTSTSVWGELTVRPWRSVTVSITPHAAEVSGGGAETRRIYGSEFGVRYEIARRIELFGQYRFAYQEARSGDIYHNILRVGVTVALPERIY
jgi:hypothetical protein